MTAFTNLKWKRIIAGGLATHAISIAALVVAIIGYTIVVVFGTGSEPNQEALQQFNSLVGTQLFPVLTVLLTAVAAAWVVRRVDPTTATAHGLAVGALVALIGLAFGAPDALMVIRVVSTIAAGALGAHIGSLSST